MEDNKNKNLELYERFRSVPQEAQKKINGGRLAGFTDINPLYRIKSLTEVFGPVGQGWFISDLESWERASDTTGEVAVFVKLSLYVKYGGEWSKPILGVGGSKLIAIEKGQLYLNDEAYKMAETDAISVACKSLGIGADVYWSKDVKTKENSTKYDLDEDVPSQPRQRSGQAPAGHTEVRLQSRFTPLDVNQYWQVVERYAKGIPAKSGQDYRSVYQAVTKAGPQEMAAFDHDAENVKLINNL